MKKKFFLFQLIVIYLSLIFNSIALEKDYFNQGKKLFINNEIDKSKIFFEKDIVFNPKSEMSYLYLAKIFLEKELDEEQEASLQNVLLLNPKNDEAIYMLALLKIKQSDYQMAKELIDTFNLVCKSMCNKKNEIKKKFDKLKTENE